MLHNLRCPRVASPEVEETARSPEWLRVTSGKSYHSWTIKWSSRRYLYLTSRCSTSGALCIFRWKFVWQKINRRNFRNIECVTGKLRIPGLPTVQFLIACSMQKDTASDQKLEGRKGWEWGKKVVMLDRPRRKLSSGICKDHSWRFYERVSNVRHPGKTTVQTVIFNTVR